MPDTETDSSANHFDEYTGKARNKTEVQFKLRTQLFNRKLMASFNGTGNGISNHNTIVVHYFFLRHFHPCISFVSKRTLNICGKCSLWKTQLICQF